MRFDDLSVFPPEDKKNVAQSQNQRGSAIVPVTESGKNYPEGDLSPDPIKYYKVRCPRCKAMPGFPCFKDTRQRVDYRTICIARVILYEVFEQGSVDVNGIDHSGHIFKGKNQNDSQ